MGKLDSDLQKAIKENLPQVVGEELKNRLQQADDFEKALKTSDKVVEKLEKELEETRDDNERLDKERKTAELFRDNAVRDYETVKAERDEVLIKLWTSDAEAAKNLAKAYENVFATIFKNPEHRTAVTKNLVVDSGENISMQYVNGQNIPVPQKMGTRIETRTDTTSTQNS